MSMLRRIFCGLLALILVVGMVPPMAVRATAEDPAATEETVAVTEETTEATEEPTEESSAATEDTTESTSETTQVTTEATTEAAEVTTEATAETTEVTEVTTEATEVTTEVTEETTEATESTAPTSGIQSDSEDPTWTLKNGVLTVSGQGAIPDYSDGITPWYNKLDQITAIVVEPGITAIGQRAFQRMPNLTRVTLPEGLVTIGNLSFYYCPRLTSINFPGTLGSIGASAFAYAGFTSLTIPGSISVLKNYAFANCGSLQTVTVQSGSVSMEDNVFDSCTALSAFYVQGNMGDIGPYTFLNCSNLKTVTVNGSLGSVGEYAFEGTGLETFTVTGIMYAIDSWAFSNCAQLKNVTLPGGLQVIGDYAFENCTALTSITIPNSVHTLGDGCFCYSGLTSVNFGSGISTISNSAFAGTPLKSVQLPGGLQTLGGSAFSGCTELESVSFPSSLTRIERHALSNTALKSVALPASVTYIGDSAFSACQKLTSVSLQSGLQTIDSYAFSYCSALTDIVIPDSVSTIGSFAFAYCTALSSATLPQNLTVIPQRLFAGCANLWQVVIHAGVRTIEASAFTGCDYLNTVYFAGSEDQWNAISIGSDNQPLLNAYKEFNFVAVPAGSCGPKALWRFDRDSGVLVITGSGTMYDYTGEGQAPWYGFRERINHIYIERNITSIGSCAFTGCTKAETVSFGTDVLRIGQYAFTNCLSLAHVLFDGVMEDLYRINIEKGNDSIYDKALYLNFTHFAGSGNIRINGSGGAFGHFKGEPGQTISYMTSTGLSDTTTVDSRGVVRIPLGTFDKKGQHTVMIDLISVNGVTLPFLKRFAAEVTVTPFTYEQTWQLSFSLKAKAALTEGAGVKVGPLEAEATLGKIGVAGDVGSSIEISREVSGNKQSLELTAEPKLSVGVEAKSGITGQAGKAEFDLSASTGLTSARTFAYGIRFDEFQPSNLLHQEAVGVFFLGEALRSQPNSIFYMRLYDAMREYVYTQAGCDVLSGSSVSIKGKIGADLGAVKINNRELFEVAGGELSAVISQSESTWTSGERSKTVSMKADSHWSVLKVKPKDGVVDSVGLLGKDLLSEDIKIAGKRKGSDKSLSITSLAASESFPSFLYFGEFYDLIYDSYTFRDQSLHQLIKDSSYFDSYVNGKLSVLTYRDMLMLMGAVSRVDAPVEFSQKANRQGVFAMDLDVGAALGVAVELGVGLSYEDSAEFEQAAGYAVDDQLYINTMSTSGFSDIGTGPSGSLWSLPDTIDSFFAALKSEAKSLYKEVSGKVQEGINNGASWIAKKVKNAWVVTLISADKKTGSGTWSTSYTVDVMGHDAPDTVLSQGVRSTGSKDSGFSRAATVSLPIVVKVETEDGEEVTDLSSDPLEFTIRYSREDLEAAGLSVLSPIVKQGGIQMYRYSDDGDYFEWVGGTNDLDAMTVTANIVKPGQYVLAADSCAPSLTSLELSDYGQTPVITAVIDDMSGLDANAFVFCLDGEEKVTGSNLAEHYTSNGIFTYTVPAGQPLAHGEHTLSFTLADTTGNSETYTYTFQTDLTVPVISDFTVNGTTNAGSCLEIRARVSDDNLTGVHAVFSQLLPDGSWSEEVTAAMGDMGDGLWGIDYTGSGCTLRVYVTATDIGGNKATSSDTLEGRPQAESLVIPQEYVLVRVGEQLTLTAAVLPQELEPRLRWSVEDDRILTVDPVTGAITPIAQGTTYVIATVSDDLGMTLTDRCRVDVTEPVTLNGVQLGSTKVTTELFRTDCPRLELVLLLPQNASLMEDSGAEEPLPHHGIAISEARFTGGETNRLFRLQILDDRRVAIVPTDDALQNPGAVKSSYKDTITVTVQGQQYTTETLTLTVKKSTPKLKAPALTFNSFYSDQSKAITVTGGTVTDIVLNPDKKSPDWLRLYEDSLYLTQSAPQKKASAKVYLHVYTEEWRIPAALTLTAKNTYTAPGLKLSARKVTFARDPAGSAGIGLTLMPRNRQQSLADLNVSHIAAPEGYSVTGFDPKTGSFTLVPEAGFSAGKITLTVHFADTLRTVPLKLTVAAADVTLKPSAKTVTLNTRTEDMARITLTPKPADHRIIDPDIRLLGSAGDDRLRSGELDLSYEAGVLSVAATRTTPAGETYTLYISSGGSPEARITVRTTDANPSVRFTAKGAVDLSFQDTATIVTPKFTGCSEGPITGFAASVAQMKGKTVLDPDASGHFSVDLREGTFRVTANPESLPAPGSYVLTLRLELPNGVTCENTVNFTVKRTAVKLKLSKKSLKLNPAIADQGAVTVSCLTPGYILGEPVCAVMDRTGKNPADGQLDVRWTGTRLMVRTTETTRFGTTYKVLIRANAFAPAVALTVTTPAQSKSRPSLSLKPTGHIDLIRDGSFITLTPVLKNVSPDTELTMDLAIFVSTADNTVDITDNFYCNQDASGNYILYPFVPLSLYEAYRAELTVTIPTAAGGTTTLTAATDLKVIVGKASLTATALNDTLYAGDRHSRAVFTLTGKDSTLNPIESVAIRSGSAYAGLLELHDLEDGTYAIGFREDTAVSSLLGTAATKSISVDLDVFLDGNSGGAPNATVRLKLKVAK